MKSINIKETFKETWALFEKHVFVLVGAYLITGILIIGPGIIMDERGMMAIPEALIMTLLVWIFAAILSPGLIRILLDTVEEREVKLETLWSQVKLTPHYFGLKVLQLNITFLGFLLFLFPGIIFAIMFSFAGFAFVKSEGGILEALTESKNLTRGYKWQLLLLFVLLGVLNIIGALLYGVGLLVTVPFSHLLVARLYNKLANEKESFEKKEGLASSHA